MTDCVYFFDDEEKNELVSGTTTITFNYYSCVSVGATNDGVSDV